MLQAEQWKELLDLCEKACGLYTRIHSFIKSCSTEDCSPATYISTPSDGPFLENSIERERICKELRAWKAATEGLLTLLSQDSASLASPPKESHQPHPAQRKDASLNPRNERLQKRPNSVVYPRPSKRSRPASSPRSPNPPKSADSQPSKPLKPTISLRPRKPLKPPPESVVSPRPPEPPKSVGSSQTPERSEPLPSLRYGCCLSDLGENMVSTIEKAREKLGSDLVEEHGYLILKLDTPLDMSDLPRLGRVSEQGTIKGFEFETSKNGAVQVRSIANPEFVEIDIPHFPEPIPASNPEEEFQNWVDNPPKTPMEYYVGDPLVDHFVNSLLHPGMKMLEAPKILGYNTLYWYLSKHAGTPAPLHKEDVERGSANALIGGAEKHWIFIYRRCAGKLLEEIRKQFKHTRCSQFVRHLNIILSPGWLKAKGIKFDIVCQRPGEILCTLPGKSYHQGRNTGANLAVAINYQFDNAPNLPSNYAWCKPGPCGSNPLTADQLGIPRIKPLCNRNMHTDFCGGDEKYFVTPLPEEVVDTSQEVQNLIQFCMNSNLPPSMLQCRDQSDLRKRLNTFLPGKSIDGTVLQILLKLIASPLRFTVIESPELDVISPTSIDHWLKEQKLVFPFHIKEGDRKDRNHWAVGVLDREGSSFTTLGLSEPLAKKWTAQLCSPKEELMNKQKSLGKNSDPALCALRCCFALERHFGSYPESLPRPKCLRKHYLRKLLMSIQQTSAISELSHEGITFNLGVIQKNVPFQTLLRAALQDTSFSIVQEKRARVIQMILQCSKASLASRPDSLEGCELSNLFRQLKRIDKTKSELVHHERVLCLKLLQKFVERVEAEGERQRRPRLKRKAEKQRGYVDGTPPEKSPNRVVIHQITPDSALQTDLRAYLERGKILSYLTSNLGSGLLKMLPTSSSYSPNFGSQCLENLLQEQIHQYPNLLEPIEPLGYDRLTWDEMSFFIKWFSFLLPAFAPPPPPPGSRSPLRVVILDESY